MLTEKQLWLDDPYEFESIWHPSFSVKDLITENKDILKRYFKVPKDLAYKIADDRNYLIHFDEDNHGSALCGKSFNQKRIYSNTKNSKIENFLLLQLQ
jgi:hypothetical protein